MASDAACSALVAGRNRLWSAVAAPGSKADESVGWAKARAPDRGLAAQTSAAPCPRGERATPGHAWARRTRSGLWRWHSLVRVRLCPPYTPRVVQNHTDGMNFITGNHWPSSVCGQGTAMKKSNAT